MTRTNFEFKASTANLGQLEAILQELHPECKGLDHQTDTYFNVPNGRLKLREGNIENALIQYDRSNISGPKQSDVLLYQHQPNLSLKTILTTALGIKTIVEKRRKIYFIDNVKFHFDEVQGLGAFVEVEAIDKDGSIGMERLKEQCRYYAKLLGIQAKGYIADSYSDLILQKMA